MPDKKPPKVFISYSWDSSEHKKWIKELATRLRKDGVETIIDQWYALPGDQLPVFMENSLKDNDFVLIICTEIYKDRADKRKGGVGYEGDIITGQLFTGIVQHRKFIPALRGASWEKSAPTWAIGKYYIDLRDGPLFEENYQRILKTFHGFKNEIPHVGRQPKFENKDKSDFEQDISGVWRGSFGLVYLSQNGRNVFGEYQYNSDKWYGIISGKVINDKLIFYWESKNEDFFHGVGFWHIETKHLTGGYFHWQEGFSYDDFLANPSKVDKIETDKYHRWELWKNY
jgi:hypothetical protein